MAGGSRFGERSYMSLNQNALVSLARVDILKTQLEHRKAYSRWQLEYEHILTRFTHETASIRATVKSPTQREAEYQFARDNMDQRIISMVKQLFPEKSVVPPQSPALPSEITECFIAGDDEIPVSPLPDSIPDAVSIPLVAEQSAAVAA